ncbi:hypothetical protein [Methylobacterium sp. J-076]|uniref:hypothetical protein n=1 Tax=Methylobacterium sp. J-076 TaxID=2836655 RepID=UPI001FB8C333|nr:hypothetical protein [Methylobacterium sp. J-076]MCJ2010921.1 hypothetical protein [Methylobacterium sp. J-076]
MNAPANRRGFLRSLTTLPLIGGGITLIGAPSAVAEPVTERLLREYHDWLMFERSELAREIGGGVRSRLSIDGVFGSALRWHRSRGHIGSDSEGRPMGDGVSFPSTRAALVLSTVGCDWREGAAWL